MQQLKKMGLLNQILGMLPGINAKALKGIDLDENRWKGRWQSSGP